MFSQKSWVASFSFFNSFYGTMSLKGFFIFLNNVPLLQEAKWRIFVFVSRLPIFFDKWHYFMLSKHLFLEIAISFKLLNATFPDQIMRIVSIYSKLDGGVYVCFIENSHFYTMLLFQYWMGKVAFYLKRRAWNAKKCLKLFLVKNYGFHKYPK